MTIQIVVPTKGCVNKCKFCVSRMHGNDYDNIFDVFQIKKRIKWAEKNGVDTCIITGTGEVFQNYHFLGRLADIFKELNHPFPNVELQTSGVMLADSHEGFQHNLLISIYDNINILKELGVNTINLSVSNVFSSEINAEIIGIPEKLKFDLDKRCFFIKTNGFNLRLSLSMTDDYDNVLPENILQRAKDLGANQVTFRKLYHGEDDSEQTKWVNEHACDPSVLFKINEYMSINGVQRYRLPFGAMVYSIMGMSVVVDDNCMNKNVTDKLKYAILRENGKLYSSWDDEGSIIF